MLTSLIKNCNYCNREMPDECIYMTHPKYGIVCEYCEPFKDGGIAPIEDEDGDQEES
jgi:hypothetical protein